MQPFNHDRTKIPSIRKRTGNPVHCFHALIFLSTVSPSYMRDAVHSFVLHLTSTENQIMKKFIILFLLSVVIQLSMNCAGRAQALPLQCHQNYGIDAIIY